MGLEPMTSPLPRECSTTELHQPVAYPGPSRVPQRPPSILRDRSQESTTRAAKKPRSNQVSCWYFPASIVRQTRPASSKRVPNATTIRPVPAGVNGRPPSAKPCVGGMRCDQKMVHRGGFEPPYLDEGQIYSLLPLTARPPVPCCSLSLAGLPSRRTPKATLRGRAMEMSAEENRRRTTRSFKSNHVCQFRNWSWRRDSNPRPPDYKSGALPAELRQRQKRGHATELRDARLSIPRGPSRW